MKKQFSDYRLFLREFRNTFRTTGAVLPSGRALARALSQNVGRGEGPLRILEVGPGTGAVTAQIVRRLGPADTLDLVELNQQFVDRLRERFETEPDFQRVALRAQIFHCPVENLASNRPYDVVISGLPLNNFSVAEVEQILSVLTARLRTGGTLSFFEYIAVRRVKSLLAGADERRRLQGIGQTLGQLFRTHHARRKAILPNIPPAWVHHVTVQSTGAFFPPAIRTVSQNT